MKGGCKLFLGINKQVVIWVGWFLVGILANNGMLYTQWQSPPSDITNTKHTNKKSLYMVKSLAHNGLVVISSRSEQFQVLRKLKNLNELLLHKTRSQ